MNENVVSDHQVEQALEEELDEGFVPSFAERIVEAIKNDAPLELTSVVEEEYTDDTQLTFTWKVKLEVEFHMNSLQDQADFLDWLAHIENPWLQTQQYRDEWKAVTDK